MIILAYDRSLFLGHSLRAVNRKIPFESGMIEYYPTSECFRLKIPARDFRERRLGGGQNAFNALLLFQCREHRKKEAREAIPSRAVIFFVSIAIPKKPTHFLDFSTHDGFHIRLCNVRKPNEKGTV